MVNQYVTQKANPFPSIPHKKMYKKQKVQSHLSLPQSYMGKEDLPF